MAVTKRLSPDSMQQYFNRFTKQFLRNDSTAVADVEILGKEFGDQVAAEGVHLLGITYDPRTAAIEFALEHGDSRTYRPKEVWAVEEDDGFIQAVEIAGEGDVKEIVRLRRLALRPLEDRSRVGKDATSAGDGGSCRP